MLRGVTRDEDEARTKRFLGFRRALKGAWLLSVVTFLAAIGLLFVAAAQPQVAKESFVLLINRGNRETPVIWANVVRFQGGRVLAVTSVGGVWKEADVGRAVEVWVPWLGRDRTFPGKLRHVHRPRSALADAAYVPWIGVIEFEAPGLKPLDISPDTADSVRDAPLEIWGVDPRSLKVSRLAGPARPSRLLSETYFMVSAGARDYPTGAAVLLRGKLTGVVADSQPVGGKIPPGREATVIAAAEVNTALAQMSGR
jgi:hypothetical protein